MTKISKKRLQELRSLLPHSGNQLTTDELFTLIDSYKSPDEVYEGWDDGPGKLFVDDSGDGTLIAVLDPKQVDPTDRHATVHVFYTKKQSQEC
jgi:hypothetical protein